MIYVYHVCVCVYTIWTGEISERIFIAYKFVGQRQRFKQQRAAKRPTIPLLLLPMNSK